MSKITSVFNPSRVILLLPICLCIPVYREEHYVMVSNGWKDMRAVMNPVATPRTKDPLKTPRKTPKDFKMAKASKLWLLSPAGWYATMELKGR